MKLLVLFILSLWLFGTSALAQNLSGYLQSGVQIKDKQMEFQLRALNLRLESGNGEVQIETSLQDGFKLALGNFTITQWGQKISLGKFLDPVGFQLPSTDKLVTLEYPQANCFPLGLGIRLIGEFKALTYRTAITNATDNAAKNYSGRLTYQRRLGKNKIALSGLAKIDHKEKDTQRIIGGDLKLETPTFSFTGGYNHQQIKGWWLLASVPCNDKLLFFGQLQGWQKKSENAQELTVGFNWIQGPRTFRHNLIHCFGDKNEVKTRILWVIQQDF